MPSPTILSLEILELTLKMVCYLGSNYEDTNQNADVPAEYVQIYMYFAFAYRTHKSRESDRQMSSVMRKLAFCICENKDADQLCSNREADQCLCFRYTDSTIPLLPKSEFQTSAIFCSRTARFVSDLFGNSEDRFSHDAAHILFSEIIK